MQFSPMNHLRNWREWELNPIVVKELRQAVRSWAVTGMLMLFLAVLFCTSLTMLVSRSIQINGNERMGADMFQVFLIILSFASFLFIPVYVGFRLGAERQESNMDLLYITTLTPERIIRGKFLCGVYMAVLFFSACMPFMAFTNLLRGIDLPSVIFILVCLFLAICGAVQVGIFVACLPISKLLKILAGLIALVLTVPMSMGLIELFTQMTRAGIGSTMGGSSFWLGFATSVCLVFAALLLLYYLSVAMISPLSANRALPLRIYITLVWLLGAVASLYWTFREKELRLMLPWAIVTFILLTLSLIVIVSNHDELSLRVRRRIPQRVSRRFLAFLFFNGAAGGLTWAALIFAATFVTIVFFISGDGLAPAPGWSSDGRKDFLVCAAACVLYVMGYSITALLLHRRFFPRRTPKLAGIFAVLLPALWALAPFIGLFFANRLTFRALERLLPGSVFNVFVVNDSADRAIHMFTAAAGFALVAILASRWYFRQWREFRPLERIQAPPAVPSASSPPPVMTTAS